MSKEKMAFFSEEDSPSFAIKVFASLSYLILTIIALSLNILLAAVFVRGHRHFSRKPFYIVARHILIADMLLLIAQFFVAVPIAFLPTGLGRAFAKSFLYHYIVTLETVGQVASVHFVAFQALSQIVPFLPRYEEILIRLSSTGSFICIFVWIWISGFLIFFTVARCAKGFSPLSLNFFFFCTYDRGDPFRPGVWAMINLWLGTLLFMAFAIYGIGLRTIYRKFRAFKSDFPNLRLENGHHLNVATITASTTNLANANERRVFTEMAKCRSVLWQGFLVCLFSIIRHVAFFAAQWLGDNLFGRTSLDGHAVLNVLGNIVSLACTLMHPTIYLYGNARMQVLKTEILEWTKGQMVKVMINSKYRKVQEVAKKCEKSLNRGTSKGATTKRIKYENEATTSYL